MWSRPLVVAPWAGVCGREGFCESKTGLSAADKAVLTYGVVGIARIGGGVEGFEGFEISAERVGQIMRWRGRDGRREAGVVACGGRRRRWWGCCPVALVGVCGVLGWLGAAPALAAVTHAYLPGVSESLSREVPAEGPLKEVVPLPGPLLGVEAMTIDEGHVWLAEDVAGENGVFRVDEFNSASGAFEAQLAQAPSLHDRQGRYSGRSCHGGTRDLPNGRRKEARSSWRCSARPVRCRRRGTGRARRAGRSSPT